MELAFRMLEKKDYKKAIDFATTGMHLDIYSDSKILTGLYTRYFLDSVLVKGTQIIAAYDKDRFLGLLAARMEGEERCFHSLPSSAFVNAIEGLAGLFTGRNIGEYGTACEEMIRDYKSRITPDGEMIFLAADPDAQRQGIGSALLKEFETREKGKTFYLLTDDQCTYQFYEHTGFVKEEERDIEMAFRKKIPLRCMLFSKTIS